MKKILLVITIYLLAAGQVSAKLFKTTELTLENGMPVVVIENHKAPIIKHMVWYKIGAVDEIRGKGGVAHLLEHLMFRGTQKVKDGEFNRQMTELGAESNAFTSYDVTAYHQFADVSKLEALMALEADRMRHLAFDQKAFDAEQKIVYQERQQVVENNPAAPFNEKLKMLLWANSPYGQPVTGQNDEIMVLKYEDARDFYQQYYAPNNALLVLSGDIEPATAQQLAEKYYGKLPISNIQRAEPKEETEVFDATLEMALPNIQAVKLVWQYLLPKHQTLGDEIYAYEVLAEYLGGGETSALYRDLVVGQKAAVTVSADYHYVTRGNTVFSVSMLPDNHVTFDKMQVLQTMQSALEQAMTNLSPKVLEQTKRKMLADLVYINDNPEEAAYLVGYMLTNGFGLEDLDKYADKISQVTLQDVQKAYQKLLSTPKVTGILLPENMKGNAQ